MRCPDCDGVADGEPGRPPVLRHAPTCPVGQATDRQDADDAAWLAARPGATRVRPLAWTETAQIAALGRNLPRAVRRRVRVHVTALAPDRLLRVVELDGVTRMATVAVLDSERAR